MIISYHIAIITITIITIVIIIVIIIITIPPHKRWEMVQGASPYRRNSLSSVGPLVCHIIIIIIITIIIMIVIMMIMMMMMSIRLS